MSIRLSVEALPFSKTASYYHETKSRVKFSDIVDVRNFTITPQERSDRAWNWKEGGEEGVTNHPHDHPLIFHQCIKKTTKPPHKQVTTSEIQRIQERIDIELKKIRGEYCGPPCNNPNLRLQRQNAVKNVDFDELYD